MTSEEGHAKHTFTCLPSSLVFVFFFLLKKKDFFQGHGNNICEHVATTLPTLFDVTSKTEPGKKHRRRACQC